MITARKGVEVGEPQTLLWSQLEFPAALALPLLVLRKNVGAERPLPTTFVQTSFRLVKTYIIMEEEGRREKRCGICPVPGHCKFEFKTLHIAGDISDVSLTSLEIE